MAPVGSRKARYSLKRPKRPKAPRSFSVKERTTRAPSFTPTPPATPKAVAPAPSTITPAGPAAPGLPATLAGLNNRTAAQENFGVGLTQINQQLMRSAQQYGSKTATQIRPDGSRYTVDVVADPNNFLAQSERAFGQNLKNLGEELGASNTFFSGIHQRRATDLADDRTRNEGSASIEFANAMNDFFTEYTSLNNALNQANRNADELDLQAQQEAPRAPGPPPSGAQILQNFLSTGPPGLKLTAKGWVYPLNGKWVKYG